MRLPKHHGVCLPSSVPKVAVVDCEVGSEYAGSDLMTVVAIGDERVDKARKLS